MGGYRKVKNSGGRRQALGLITAQTKHRQNWGTHHLDSLLRAKS